MTNKKKEIRRAMKIIKRSFNELGLSVEQDTVYHGVEFIGTQIDADSFSMAIEVAYGPIASELIIAARFSLVAQVHDYTGFYSRINVINDLVMDIGHFAINMKEGTITFMSGLDRYGDGFNAKQVVSSLKRFIYHGREGFKYLLRISAPENLSQEATKEIIAEMVGRLSKGRKE